MQTHVRLRQDEMVRTYGIRASAVPYREQIEQSLAAGDSVVIDFSGYDVTQSFVDELIGSLILRRGREIFSRLVFENCSSEVKGIIRFVVQDRVSQVSSHAVA